MPRAPGATKKTPINVPTRSTRAPRSFAASISIRSARAGPARPLAFLFGLAEMPLEDISLSHVSISMAPDARPDYPDMADDLEMMQRAGLYIRNARRSEPGSRRGDRPARSGDPPDRRQFGRAFRLYHQHPGQQRAGHPSDRRAGYLCAWLSGERRHRDFPAGRRYAFQTSWCWLPTIWGWLTSPCAFR